jgi:hypothetical protein
MSNEEIQTVTMHIDFALLQAMTESKLNSAAQLAAFGISAIETALPQNVRMPGAMMQLSPTVSTNELAELFPNWLASNAIREYLRIITSFIEQICCNIVFAKRVGVQDARWTPYSVWVDINKKSFPSKLDFIESETGLAIHRALRRDWERLNKARNCLEHRDGIVTDRDGDITLSWRAIELLERRTDGTELPIRQLPYETQKDSSIRAAVAERSQQFPIGSRLNFSASDVWEMSMSLIQGVKMLVELAQNFVIPLSTSVQHISEAQQSPFEDEANVKRASFEFHLYGEPSE